MPQGGPIKHRLSPGGAVRSCPTGLLDLSFLVKLESLKCLPPGVYTVEQALAYPLGSRGLHTECVGGGDRVMGTVSRV